MWKFFFFFQEKQKHSYQNNTSNAKVKNKYLLIPPEVSPEAVSMLAYIPGVPSVYMLYMYLIVFQPWTGCCTFHCMLVLFM